MPSLLSYYITLVKRWAWLIILGVIVCGGATYIVSKRVPPVYEASATVIINIEESPTSASDNISASEQIAPTYALLLTSPKVLNPVLAQHPELTLAQLKGMVTTKFQPNTTLVEIDVDNSNPDLAMQLANEIGQSFTYYANTQLPGNVNILPAERPIVPLRPKPSQYAGIGALVGLGLALALIVIFEWIDDHPARPEEVENLLGLETLTVVPRLSHKLRNQNAEETPAFGERMRILCASLNAAQAIKPFKLVMITSALPGEGKSTIAANLGPCLARAGKRVLLVDADLCHPTLDQHFHLVNDRGLSDALQDVQEQINGVPECQKTDIPRLYVLTAGRPSSNSSELLQQPPAEQLFSHFRKAPFDYIIFDSSPLLPVVDARILASHIQATVLVVDTSKTSRGVLRRARQILSRTRCMTVGVVMNKSLWPDSGESRHYLIAIRKPKRELTMHRPSDPPVEDVGADADSANTTKLLMPKRGVTGSEKS